MQTEDPPPPPEAVAESGVASIGERVVDPQAIAGEMRALALADAPIFVHPLAQASDGFQILEPWMGRIEKLDPESGDFVLGPHGNSGVRFDASFRLACKHGARLLGIYEGVHVEFELGHLGAHFHEDVWRLTGRTPKLMYRLQRRETYRVRVIDAGVVLRLYRLGRWTTLIVEDVSEGGLRVRIPGAQATPVRGTRWGYCKLELPESDPIICDLQVVHVAVPGAGVDGRAAGERTAGLRFEKLEAHDAFELRRWIVARQLEEAALRFDTED